MGKYISECPFCGQKHSLDKENDAILSSADKILSIPCASNHDPSIGCKTTILIMSKTTFKHNIKT